MIIEIPLKWNKLHRTRKPCVVFKLGYLDIDIIYAHFVSRIKIASDSLFVFRMPILSVYFPTVAMHFQVIPM